MPIASANELAMAGVRWALSVSATWSAISLQRRPLRYRLKIRPDQEWDNPKIMLARPSSLADGTPFDYMHRKMARKKRAVRRGNRATFGSPGPAAG